MLYPGIAITTSHHGVGWTSWSTVEDRVEFKSALMTRTHTILLKYWHSSKWEAITYASTILTVNFPP
jgi:hypothetical protein